MTVDANLTHTADDILLVKTTRYDRMPTYYIYGGYVFSPLTRNLLLSTNRNRLALSYFATQWPTENKKEVVVLIKVLASDISRGNNGFAMWPIEKINGETFDSFKTFFEKLSHAKGRYVVLEDKEGVRVVIDRKEAEAKQKEILERYNIKYDRSVDLRTQVSDGNEAQLGISREYHLELLVTARAQMELHGLDASSVLEVWQKLQGAQIITRQTLTDNFRSIVTDPYDGRAEENRVEVYPHILQMQSLFLDKPEWMGMLPRKFNVAISGTRKSHGHFFGNDLYFALAKRNETWGFNLYLGGKNSEVAEAADIFVLPENVPAMFEAVARAYSTYGLRGSRAKTRLFHLLSEIGMASFVEKISEFYPYTIEKAGTMQYEKRRFSPFVTLKEGRFGYCYQTHFGKIDAGEVETLLNYAKKASLEIRLGVDQNIYLLGLEEQAVPFATDTGSSHIVACAGSVYCALSLWDIKAETAYLPLKKIEAHNYR